MPTTNVNIMWFRRDLRLEDNAALYHALKSNQTVVPIFIFDKKILDDLEDKEDRRVEFIRNALLEMQETLMKLGSTLEVYYGLPEEVFKKLMAKYNIEKVFTNHDYEPYATERDGAINNILYEAKISFHTFKDQVILEKNEVLKDDGRPYTIFTPYSRRWKAILTEFHLKAYPTNKYFKNFYKQDSMAIPSLESIGFKAKNQPFPSAEIRKNIIENYKAQRDIPGIEGTSRLGVHIRFGTISIRQLTTNAQDWNETYLNELIWRDFYHMILWHYPKVGKGRAFKEEYENIKWRNNEQEFKAWCEGKTGYPIVDAGMRQLNETGFMHNRVRMITASFLCKHLLIDWHWGEAYFAVKLLDYDLAANNGGWQWAASTGCDAVPFFRIFNPTLQTQRFDADFKYIREWVPEFEGFDYPQPIVVHEQARKRALDTYKAALNR